MGEVPVTVAIPLRWKSPNGVDTIYANHLLVAHSGGEFYLIFGEVEAPLIMDPQSEALPEVVEVKPVAKIVVSPQNILAFTAALQENLRRYEARFDAGAEVDDANGPKI